MIWESLLWIYKKQESQVTDWPVFFKYDSPQINTEPRALYMYKTDAKILKCLLCCISSRLWFCTQPQSTIVHFFFSLTGGFASHLYYWFTVSNYRAVRRQMVNKLSYCLSGAPSGTSWSEPCFMGLLDDTPAACGHSPVAKTGTQMNHRNTTSTN